MHRLETYTSFIVFHGCRPTDVSSYYASGLQPSNLGNLDEVARSIFLSPHVPTVTEHALTRAIASISRNDHGKLCVVLDERDLIRYSGHYMIYGSEHLCGIGASLLRESGFDYRQILKRCGKPTVFRCRLPRVSIPQSQIENLARYLNEVTWEDDRRRPSPPLLDCSFILRDPIPAEHVLGHVHPEVIPEPHFYYLPYRYKDEVA
jgi:hypothetical protein